MRGSSFTRTQKGMPSMSNPFMEHSEKARERKEAEWYVETTIQEAKRRMLVDKQVLVLRTYTG